MSTEIEQFHELMKAVRKVRKEVTMSFDSLASLEDEITALEADNKSLQNAIAQVIIAAGKVASTALEALEALDNDQT